MFGCEFEHQQKRSLQNLLYQSASFVFKNRDFCLDHQNFLSVDTWLLMGGKRRLAVYLATCEKPNEKKLSWICGKFRIVGDFPKKWADSARIFIGGRRSQLECSLKSIFSARNFLNQERFYFFLLSWNQKQHLNQQQQHNEQTNYDSISQVVIIYIRTTTTFYIKKSNKNNLFGLSLWKTSSFFFGLLEISSSLRILFFDLFRALEQARDVWKRTL